VYLPLDRHHLSGLLMVWCYASSAENAVNERLAHTPELYLLALAHFAIAADTEVVSLYRGFLNEWLGDGGI
jgi:hypothetical protein